MSCFQSKSSHLMGGQLLLFGMLVELLNRFTPALMFLEGKRGGQPCFPLLRVGTAMFPCTTSPLLWLYLVPPRGVVTCSICFHGGGLSFLSGFVPSPRGVGTTPEGLSLLAGHWRHHWIVGGSISGLFGGPSPARWGHKLSCPCFTTTQW